MIQSSFTSDFNLSIKEYAADNEALHRHNYFELIYVLEGRGIHVINENQFAYGKSDLFLLTPEDAHTFLTHDSSRFCIIDFTSAFFGHNLAFNKADSEGSYFFRQLEYLFQNGLQFNGFIKLEAEDAVFAETLIHRLILEYGKEVFLKDIIVRNLVFLLLNIIARYAETVTQTSKVKSANKIYEMIAYIQHHIYDNDLLTTESLALHFSFSKDYIGTYFKSQTGTSIKQFTLDYKLELVKVRLLYSNLTISQIAYELSFTDESHLNKVFKNKYRMTAKQYRDKKSSPLNH